MAEEWWKDESLFREVSAEELSGEVGPDDWIYEAGAFRGPGVTRGEMMFPTDPTLGAEELEALPEMTHSGRIIEGFAPQGGDTPLTETMSSLGTELEQAWLQMTTSDPIELAQILKAQFPDLIDVRLAPNPSEDPDEVESYPFIPVVRNNNTGYEAVVNKPGFSGMDVLQTIGLIGQFTPSAKLTAIPRTLTGRAAAGAATSGLTEHLAQTYQREAGGQYDPEDVAMATAFGGAGEYIFPGAIALGSRAKQYFSRVDDIADIPVNIRQALKYAEEAGADVTTSDALQEGLTPSMRIFLRIAERIPVFGTAAQRRAQNASRADALSDVAERFGIEMETDLGGEIAQNWINRMLKNRWFGRNQRYAEPGAATQDMLQRAFGREADSAIDVTLRNKLRKIKDAEFDQVADIVELVLKGNRGAAAGDLMKALTPDGQQMLRQEFLRRGLASAGWEQGVQQTVPNPKAFLNYLDNNKNVVSEIFEGADRELVDGVREYIRITSDAAGFAEGAGMTAAMATGSVGAMYFLDLVGGAFASAGTGFMARGAQSELMRNLLLRLKHVKGNREAEALVMDRLRPLFLSLQEQYFQEKGDMPALFSGPGGAAAMRESGAGLSSSLSQLAGAASQGIGNFAMGLMGGEPPVAAGNPLVGPGLERAGGLAEALAAPPDPYEEAFQ